MRQTILLLLLLMAIMLLYKVLQKEEPITYYGESDMYLIAESPPCYIANQALASKTEGEFFNLISQYNWDSHIAYEIMLCESSGNPEAHNYNHRTKDNSWGLFQVNLYGNLANNRPTAKWLKVPENNISYAYELYRERGWKPWGNCYKKVKSR
jgi:hypothetical protein